MSDSPLTHSTPEAVELASLDATELPSRWSVAAHDATIACCAGLGISALTFTVINTGAQFHLFSLGRYFVYATWLPRYVVPVLIVVGSLASFKATAARLPRLLFGFSFAATIAWQLLHPSGIVQIIARAAVAGIMIGGCFMWLRQRKALVSPPPVLEAPNPIQALPGSGRAG